MKRNIVKIDQEKCNGCGLCVNACHERAIILNDQGKAELVKEDYCDGLGDCLPACPMDAITIEKRECAPYDEAAVKERIRKMDLEASDSVEDDKKSKKNDEECTSCLSHWPVQIRLASSSAECFDGCDLLIAADCTAYAYADFHRTFMKNRVTVAGCPKLDAFDYEEKLYEIFTQNDIRSITLVRMEVPCCGGMQHAMEQALKRSGKLIPSQTVVLSLDGRIIR